MGSKFSEFKFFIKKLDKRLLALIVVVFLIIVSFSVVRCSEVHSLDEGNGEQTNTTEEVNLTTEQQTLYNSYEEDDFALLNLLSTNTWTSADGEKSVSFTNTSFTETNGSETNKVTFAISTLDVGEQAETDDAGNAYTLTVYTAAILTEDNNTFLLRLYANGSSLVQVESEAFSSSDVYFWAEKSGGVTVSGINDSFNSMIDGKSVELIETIQEYCSSHYPAATKAEWTQTADIDYVDNQISTSFTLDNNAQTTLWVTYHLDSQTFEIK